MTTLKEIQLSQGAALAPDNIPLHFGSQQAEYQAAVTAAVLLDRSHEARLQLEGQNRLDMPHRISTNDLMNMGAGEGRPTIFTSPLARILDRVEVYNMDDAALMLGEPGRGTPLANYLRRNIFFGDDVRLTDLAAAYHQFDLHGPQAAAVAQRFLPASAALPPGHAMKAVTDGQEIIVARRTPVVDERWTLLAPADHAASVWQGLAESGAMPAGSLVYNVLRIRAGLPSVGRELSEEYIPLEVGLWDEVSFRKGCYTGQEIIARMESRQRLARTLVTLTLAEHVPAPAEVYAEGKSAGRLTSSVVAPDGEIFALAVVKAALAQPGQALTVGENRVSAQIKALAGIQPEYFASQQEG